MTGDSLPDSSHVLRYIKPTLIKSDHTIDGSAFRLRPKENGLSVNWLEYDQDLDAAKRVENVIALIASRLSISKSGCFAEIPVGRTIEHLAEKHDGVRFIHRPLAATKDHNADPSHSEIERLPAYESDESALIGDMIAECVKDTHPARVA